MATETDWSCPICQDARDDVVFVMPCRHQFCLGCILRWTEMKAVCPLCRRQIETVRFSVRGERDDLQCVISLPEVLPDASSQAGRAPGRLPDNRSHRPVASPPSSLQGMLSPEEQGAAGPEAVGGLLPKVWAELFRRQEHLLDPVLPWLRQVLEAIYGARWWQARSAESSVLHALCLCGPNEEVMVQMLQDYLKEYTAPLVHGLINIMVCQCSEEARRLLRAHAAGQEDDSRGASSSSSSASSSSSSSSRSRGGTPNSSLASSSSPAASDVEDQPRTLEAALRRGPGRPTSAPVPAEQEQPQEGPGEAAVAGPSAAGRGRACSPGGPRRPPKRRVPSPPESPQACKRPPRRWR
ncbi:TOPRS ligase, partial [Ciconia maguari]|nr:TOPRS ligase [Ciconia maguari]